MNNDNTKTKKRSNSRPRRVRCMLCGELVPTEYSPDSDFAVGIITIAKRRLCICCSCVEDLDNQYAAMESEALQDEQDKYSSFEEPKKIQNDNSDEKNKINKNEKSAQIINVVDELRRVQKERYPALDLSIDSIEAFVNERVIGQEEAVRKIIITLFYNQRSAFLQECGMDFIKPSNILIRGNTGVGKTYSIKTILSIMKIPYTIFNVTSITSAGYIGDKVENALENLYDVANGNLERAERGVLVLDEIDKKVSESSSERDVAGKAVQQELLKFLEPTKVRIKHGNVEFDTSNLTVIMLGAFVGLDEIIDKRLNVKKIGFDDIKQEETKREILPEDIINYGFIPEFVGRAPVFVEFKKLKKNDIVDIIWISRDSILKQIVSMFECYGIEVCIDQMVIEDIADEIMESKTGARDIEMKLKTLFEKPLYHLYKQPGSGYCEIHEDKSFTMLLKSSDNGKEKIICVEA